MNSLKVGREMTVWETEWTGSMTQPMSLAWQDLTQRMVSARSTLVLLIEGRYKLLTFSSGYKKASKPIHHPPSGIQ